MVFRQLLLFSILISTQLIGWAASPAERARIAPNYSDMVRTINRQGFARVIVVTDQQTPVSNLRSASVASKRQAILDKLARKNIQAIGLSRFGNRAVFSANLLQLDELIDTAGIEQVFEDRLMKPNLASASNVINTAVPHSAGLAGAGVAVAILDTGIDGDHEAFGNRIVAEACFSTKYSTFGATHLCSQLSQNGPNGQRTDTGTGSAEACSGVNGCDHGTHVASIAAGYSGTITGIAPQANIIAIQVFSKITDYEPACGTPTGSCLNAFTSDVLDALDYVASLSASYTIAAVNLSLGDGVQNTTYCTTDAYNGPINTLYNLGIVTAAATGNDGYLYGVASPACVQNALSVGAVRDDDIVPNWSNSDDVMVDMLAPGVGITAAITNGGYGSKSGTSMATPMVTGALALLKSDNPALSAAQMTSLLADYSWTTSTQVLNNRANNDPEPRLDLGKVFLPRLQITSPADGSIYLDTDAIALSATADDSQDGNISNTVTWSSSLDGAISSPATLSPGAHQITASVVDSDGILATASINLTVNATDPDSDSDGLDDEWELANFGDLTQDGSGDFDGDGLTNSAEFTSGSNPTDRAPVVSILSPTNGTPYPVGALVTLSGNATDYEDGNIGASISWSSSIDGFLGTGSAANIGSLSPGAHSISATVTDSAGGPPLAPATIQVLILSRDGDVNDDGKIDAIDVLLLEKHILGQQLLAPASAIRADIYPVSGTGDGTLNASDLLLMQKNVLGL